MTTHITISPTEAGDRLAIRELVEAYAHCADRRDAKGQMSLFTTDTHFVVYMNAKDPTPSQELRSREALAPVFADLNKYDATTHFIGQSTISTLDERASDRRSLLPRASRHSRRRQAPFNGCVAPLPRHVREDRRGVALLGATVVRGLDRRATAGITVLQKRPVIVGAGQNRGWRGASLRGRCHFRSQRNSSSFEMGPMPALLIKTSSCHADRWPGP